MTVLRTPWTRGLRTGVALAACLLCLGACGYRLGGVPCDADFPARSVAVPLFRNDSFEPLAEDVFTVAFREQVEDLPCVVLRPVRDAEAVLRGTVERVEVYPVAVDRDFLVLEYGMRVTLRLSLVARDDGPVLWESGALLDEARYYASQEPAEPSDPMLLQANRREALILLARKMAQRAMDRLLLGHGRPAP